MNLDDFKEPWKEQQRALEDRVDHVIEAVRSRMSGFDQVIRNRDLRESVAALFLFIWYAFDFFRHSEWLAKVGLGFGMFACTMIMVIMHWARLKGRMARPELPLQEYCTAELARVDRQIWLLRHINWWYTGPLFFGAMITLLGVSSPLQVLTFSLTMLLPIAGGIYWLNQRAVRNELMPIRHELNNAMEMTANTDTTVSEDASPVDSEKFNWKVMILAIIGWMVIVLIGAYLNEKFDVDKDAPKVSPFTEVIFEGEQIIVTYDGEPYQWLEIDEIKVEDIVTAAKWRFGFIWQKRVSEDLIDILWKMNHKPGDTVQLLLRDTQGTLEIRVEDAPLTTENRYAIYWNRENADAAAALAQEYDEKTDLANSKLPIDENLRARLVGRYELTPDFIFDVQDHEGRLMVGITNQTTQEVFPDSATHWTYGTIEATLEFKLKKTGPAEYLVLHQNGISQIARRMNK